MHYRRIAAIFLALAAPLLFGLLLFAAALPSGTAFSSNLRPTSAIQKDVMAHSCAMIVVNFDSSGPGSLRDAIANVCDGGLITFDIGLANGTIDISPDGELLINKSVTISGTVPITVSGNDAVRVFNDTDGKVTFDGLTIADGNVQTSDCGTFSLECGGGIILQNIGVAVTVTNSTLYSNTAAWSGGGIFSNGTLLVINSTLSGNSTSKDGGGIENWGNLAVNNCTLSDNSASSGGGINNASVNPTYTGTVPTTLGGIIPQIGRAAVTNSTLSGNSAERGGGIFNYGGTVTMTNSTFSGNSAQYGGGIFNGQSKVIVRNSTLSNNRAGTSGGGISSNGGNRAITIIHNTIVAGNVISGTTTASDLALYDGSFNTFTSKGYNLIGATGAGVIFDGLGDQTDVYDPGLGPLADDGDETMTRALLPGSLAIDAGGSCDVASDQRGIDRPQGSDCDTGAYESRGFSLVLTGGSPQTTIINTAFADPLDLMVSSAYGEPVEGGIVTLSAPLSGAGLTFTETMVAIGGGGAVGLAVTANGTEGLFEVTGNASGNGGDGLIYRLTNVLSLDTFLPVVIR